MNSLSPGFILDAVAAEFGIVAKDLILRGRKEPLPVARHIAMGLFRRVIGLSTRDTAHLWSRTSSDVVRSGQTLDDLIATDKTVAARWERLRSYVQAARDVQDHEVRVAVPGLDAAQESALRSLVDLFADKSRRSDLIAFTTGARAIRWDGRTLTLHPIAS